MVVSHERSGTHFLINAITGAYGYSEHEFLDFDQQSLNINYFLPELVAAALARVATRSASAIVKSHHAVDFFDGVLDDVLKHIVILYIHRDPVDVMISYWRFIARWKWHEGPRRPTAVEFAASEPEGMMMRYQVKQAPTLLHRWASHVDGWTAAAAGRRGISVVRYDELVSHYGKAIGALGGLLGPRSGTLAPPDRNINVVGGLPADQLPVPDRDALRALALAEVGDTMRRHGYA